MKKYVLYLATFLTGMLSGYSLLPQKVVVERCSLDHSKDYQAACVLSDICRIALDDPYLDAPGFEDLYWDYILNLDTDPSLDITWEQVHKDYCHQY